CRAAVPSPCSGGTSTHHWSMHAYGEAVDIDPRENPYVGCGMTRDKTALSYLKRSWHRPGMVTPAVLRAFTSIGWGWGGSWVGSNADAASEATASVTAAQLTRLGRVSGYLLDYGNPFGGAAGVTEIQTAIERYRNAADARKGLDFWRRDELNSSSLKKLGIDF